MKNENNLYSNSFNSKQIIKTDSSINKRYENTSPNINHPKYHLLFNSNNYLSKKKNIFKPEKKKDKENIFKYFKEVPKKQIKREQITLNRNHKQLLKSFAVLNNANIDEGIVLNKYFIYLKKSGVEYKELMNLKLKNMLTPIKEKEKEIQNMKKNINFYKSISNQMLMKYMLDNKDKLYEYISSYKNKRNYESYHDFHSPRNITFFSDKSNSKSFSNLKNHFLTSSKNNNQRNTYIRRQLLENKKKKIIPKLKLVDNRNNIFITTYSRNRKKYYSNKKVLTTPKSSEIINRKYFTPQLTKRKNKINNLTTEKSTGIINDSSSRRICKVKDYNFKNIFDKIKIKALSLE